MRKDCSNCKHDDSLQNAICRDCYNTSDAPTKWEPAYNYEPDTNADRIRAMSDEELAEFLYDCEFLHICKEGCGECHYNGECEKRIAEWLKKPAEEE